MDNEATETSGVGMQTKPDMGSEKNIITALQLVKKPGETEIIIEGNNQLKYTSIKQSFPFGIAIYMPETALGDSLESLTLETGDISNIIPSYADQDKKTAKIEILLNKDLSYNIDRQENNLLVSIPTGKDTNMAQDTTKKTSSQSVVGKNNNKAVQMPKGIANLSDIDFTVEDEGNSELKLVTSHPVKYDFSKGKKGILYLNLYKTTIPQRHKRPFETKYFKSAVHRILPMQNSTKNSKIEISLREKVPYQVVQNNNVLVVKFEPSSIEPPKFTKADKTPTDRIVSAESIEQPVESTNTSHTSQAFNAQNGIIHQPTSNSTNPANIKLPETLQVQNSTAVQPVLNQQQGRESFTDDTIEKKYTGEKIKLDFYETDIKNVFRILSSISNKNFAIDKDVTGTVTLTLDTPIPWDQVMDLVLSMNQLEKVEKGNVIRIATQKTIAEEAEQRHSKFEAQQKAKAAQKSLEPLITEYIPINYANAETDILPHIQNILTEDRGSASVDARTNMLIITDTKAIVRRAKSLIYTLDNVTPQIMISAKIVEANKEFSREFGLGLQIGFNENTATHGDDAYNVSLNAPATATNPDNTASFTFHNFMGGHGENIFGPGTAFLSATLNAAESKGDVSILSSPKILTLDNKEARIKQGLDWPYPVVDEEGKITVEFKEINLELIVTPHVTPDRRISMKLFVTKNERTGVEVQGVPPIITNEARTELLVNNNDTIVIGGVLKSYQKDMKSGFPVLMNIPLLGRIFRTDTRDTDKQELLIFITPTIVQLEQKKNELPLLEQALQ